MKSDTRTQHLTDAEFSELLAGGSAEDATLLHLGACDFCRSELKSVKDSLASFTGLSTQWAQATAPQQVPVPSRWARNLGLLPSWTTGLAMTALTGLLVFNFGPAHRMQTHAVPSSVAQTGTAQVPSNTELADDKQLMQSIDQELGYRERSAQSLDALGSGDRKLDQTASAAVVD